MPILHVVHNLTDFGHFGGTELVVDELLKVNRPQFVFAPQRGAGGAYAIYDRSKHVVRSFKCHLIDFHQVFDPDLTEFLRKALQELDIDLVIFHQMIHFPVSLLSVPARFGVRTAVVWHDYYLACPSFNLLNEFGRFCAIDRLPLAECEGCSAKLFGWPEGAMQARRRFIRECFSLVDFHFFSTPESRRLVGRIYRLPEDRVRIVPVPSRVDLPSTVRTRRRDMSKVLLLGNVSRNKGSALIPDVAKGLNEAGFTLAAAGRIDDLPANAADLVQTLGFYARATLADRVSDFGIALFMSTWPETYSLTLSEARQLGLTPVAADIGAFRDRIEDGRDGWLFCANDAKGVVAAVKRARDHGPLSSDERTLNAADYLETILSTLPPVMPSAALIRKSGFTTDLPLDLRSFSVAQPIYYLPNQHAPVIQQSRNLVAKAMDSLRRDGVRMTLAKTRAFLKQRTAKRP